MLGSCKFRQRSNMKLLSIPEAERSADLDIKLVAVRASRFRVFGSSERIPDSELAVADLRDSSEPADFAERFQVLDQHPMAAVMLRSPLSPQPKQNFPNSPPLP